MSILQKVKNGFKTGISKGTSALLGLLGATTAAELVFYCAFKGAILCGGLGTLIPGLGNITGFVVGAILGAGLAGALLLIVYKVLVVLDKKINGGTSNLELNQNPNNDRKLIEKINAFIKQSKPRTISGRLVLENRQAVSAENNPNLPNITSSFKTTTTNILRQFILGKKNLDVKIEQLRAKFATLNNNLENQLEKLLLTSFQLPNQDVIKVDDNSDSLPVATPVNIVSAKKTLSIWERIKQSVKTVYQSIKDYKSFFKIAGGVAAIGTFVSCAYYGAMIGGTVGTAIPILGNIGGFIAGGILGALSAGALVFLVGKGVVKIDTVLSDKNKDVQKVDLMSQLKKMRTEIARTKEQLIQLKIAATEQINILNRAEQHRVQISTSSQSVTADATQSSHRVLPPGGEINIQEHQAILITDGSTVTSINTAQPLLAHIKDNTEAKNTLVGSANTIIKPGFFTSINNLYHMIKKPTLIIAGVPAALVTIFSCSYYGALMGAALGTAVPGLGNLAGLIIGAILGAAVAGVLVYLTAKGLIALDKKIFGEDKHSLLVKELDDTQNELTSLNNEVIELNQSIAAKKQFYSNPSRNDQPNQTSTVTPDRRSAAAEVIENLALESSAVSVNDDKKTLLSSSDKNKKKGFLNFVVNIFHKVKGPILKFLGGTAGAITVGTCGYYGAMIGLSVGSVFPGPGNIIGGIVGGILGSMIGFAFVTIAAKIGSAVHEKITHSKSETVNTKVTKLETELSVIDTNKNTLNNNLDDMRQIWEATYSATSGEVMVSRIESGKLVDRSNNRDMTRRVSDKRNIDHESRNSGSPRPATIGKPITPAPAGPFETSIGHTLLSPPGKPMPKHAPPPTPKPASGNSPGNN